MLRRYDHWLRRPLWQRLPAYVALGAAGIGLGFIAGAMVPTLVLTGIYAAEWPAMGGAMVRTWTKGRRRYPRTTARLKVAVQRTSRKKWFAIGIGTYGLSAVLLLGGSALGLLIPGLIGAGLFATLMSANFVYTSVTRYHGHTRAAARRALPARDAQQMAQISAPEKQHQTQPRSRSAIRATTPRPQLRSRERRGSSLDL